MEVPTRSEVEAKIAQRIAVDPAYRETLLADPRKVVAEIVGFDIPESVQVVLHEESPTEIHLTIPSTDVLSEADLDLVGGGMRWNGTFGSYACHLPPTIA